MSQPAADPSPPGVQSVIADTWHALEACERRVPAALMPWLSEPGLLTARVRTTCGEATALRLLRLESAPLSDALQRKLAVRDSGCRLREIEISCGRTRWIFARSVFPDSTVERYPMLLELGDNGLGESLARVAEVRREPLEYQELAPGHELARAALGAAAMLVPLWARRAVYRLGGSPILVQEVFLPGLGRVT